MLAHLGVQKLSPFMAANVRHCTGMKNRTLITARPGASRPHPPDKTSACSSTVWVAFSCFSGGVTQNAFDPNAELRAHLLRRRVSSRSSRSGC